MRTATAELSDLVRSGIQQAVSALGRAASEGLDAQALTDLLQVAFTAGNRLDAALTGAVAALDQAAARTPDGEATLGLSCPAWLSHTLRISANAAHAQVHLARALPSLPATAAAFARGELSPQHASVVVRATEQVTRGGGDPGTAEVLLLEEAGRRDPRELLRWGLGLLHRLAPQEMEAEEERRHRRRYLRLSEAFGGGYDVEGYLDPEGGALLKTALNGGGGAAPKGRRADARPAPG